MNRVACMKLMVDLATQFMTTVPKPVPQGWLAARQEVQDMIDEIADAEAIPAKRANLALDVAEPFHIEGVMAISTAHVKKETMQQLTDDARPLINVRPFGDHGVVVYITPDWSSWKDFHQHYLEDQVPTDLFDCMLYARSHGCVWLLLDADATELDNLETYEW